MRVIRSTTRVSIQKSNIRGVCKTMSTTASTSTNDSPGYCFSTAPTRPNICLSTLLAGKSSFRQLSTCRIWSACAWTLRKNIRWYTPTTSFRSIRHTGSHLPRKSICKSKFTIPRHPRGYSQWKKRQSEYNRNKIQVMVQKALGDPELMTATACPYFYHLARNIKL